jgi:hypothetical protein
MSGNRALLVSETGWRGIKEFASSLVESSFHADIVIKGGVEREVLEVISRPEGVRIRAVPRPLFIAHLFFYILWNAHVMKRLKMVIVSKEKTGEWVRLLGVETKLLTETSQGYSLKRIGQ